MAMMPVSWKFLSQKVSLIIYQSKNFENRSLRLQKLCPKFYSGLFLTLNVVTMQALLWKPLPSLVFGVLCTIAGLLYMFLPETIGQLLPDTIEEVERFRRRSRKEKW